jgi:hypothetical protein
MFNIVLTFHLILMTWGALLVGYRLFVCVCVCGQLDYQLTLSSILKEQKPTAPWQRCKILKATCLGVADRGLLYMLLSSE